MPRGVLPGGQAPGPYGVSVEPAGLIVAALVAVWIAYLVPWFTTRVPADPHEPIEPADDTFGDHVTMVRRSDEWDVPDDDAAVSTPLTRRAALREVRQMAWLATVRRRRLLVALLVLTLGVGVAEPLVALIPWWAVLVPAGLLAASLGVSRISVRTLDAALSRRTAAIKECWECETITIGTVQETPLPEPTGEVSVEITAPPEKMSGTLWDPIPVIQASYVTRPMVPRTVRTIDLSAPAAPIVEPPTAEPPSVEQPDPAASDDESRRAQGA